MNNSPPLILFVAACSLLFVNTGCHNRAPDISEETSAPSSAEITSAEWSELDDQFESDEAINSIIEPYREKLNAVMDEELGVAEAALARRLPESPLGNFIADAILRHAQDEIDSEADLALMNRGGIRLPELPAGPITVADVYQLAPFDNRIVVLTLSGKQIESLIQSLAKKQGEPFSGVVYQLKRTQSDGETESWSAVEIQVAGNALEPDETYQLATLDYLAGIGGELAVLQEASNRQDGGVFLRDVLISDIRERKTIKPLIDQRVTYVQETSE